MLLAGHIANGTGRRQPFAFLGDGAAKAVNGLVRFKGAVVGVPK